MAPWVGDLRRRAALLKANLYLLWRAAHHPRTPLMPRLLIALALAYALSPIDLIPDFIPILGLLDDLILLPMVLSLAYRLIPDEVMAEVKAQIVSQESKRLPRSRAGTIMIFMIWLGAAWLVGRWAYVLL